MNEFIVYLGNEGYEGSIDVTDLDSKSVMEKLQTGNTIRLNSVIAEMERYEHRSRYNSHRDITPYIVNIDLTQSELASLCRSGDSLMCKTIREKCAVLSVNDDE